MIRFRDANQLAGIEHALTPHPRLLTLKKLYFTPQKKKISRFDIYKFTALHILVHFYHFNINVKYIMVYMLNVKILKLIWKGSFWFTNVIFQSCFYAFMTSSMNSLNIFKAKRVNVQSISSSLLLTCNSHYQFYLSLKTQTLFSHLKSIILQLWHFGFYSHINFVLHQALFIHFYLTNTDTETLKTKKRFPD